MGSWQGILRCSPDMAISPQAHIVFCGFCENRQISETRFFYWRF